MPRLARFVPVVASTLTLALTLTACDAGSVRDTTGASGVNDPYLPKAGNGGYWYFSKLHEGVKGAEIRSHLRGSPTQDRQ